MLTVFQLMRELSRRFVVVAAASIFLWAGVSHAQTFNFTYQQGDGGLFSTTDATYISGHPAGVQGSNFGGASTMFLENEPSSTQLNARPLIRFPDIFGNAVGQIPLGAKINSATLSVTTAGGQFAGSNDIESVHQVLSNWAENSVTWNSFNSGGVAGIDYDSTPLDTFQPNAINSAFAIDVTAALSDVSAGNNPNLGFLLISPGTDQAEFLSDDSGTILGRPSLTVNFSVPEPASIAIWSLLGLVVTGFGYHRLRRAKLAPQSESV